MTKKIFSILALLCLTVSGAWADDAKVKYALTTGETFTSGQTVEVKDDADAVVATITYGETGGAEFNAAKKDANVTGYTAYTDGNGTNGDKTGGTFYTIVPVYDGTIDVAVVLNKDKAFYILEDGTALESYNGIKENAKYYGTYPFSVSAGKSYKFYCAGSKLGFYGFEYTYTPPVPPVTIDVTPTANANEWTFLMPGYDVEVGVVYDTELALSEETDNTAALDEWDGYEADVTLTRTLATGGWNTLALPFSIDATSFAGLQYLLTTQGGSITLKQLSSSAFDAGTLTLNFTDATSIEAGKPYLVKVTKALNFATLPTAIVALGGTNPFAGLEISKTLVPTTTTAVDFIPTLGLTEVTGDTKEILFVSSGNKLLHPTTLPDNMKGFRAYFLLKGDAVNASSFTLDFGDGETTSINEELRMKNEEFATAPVYDLQGRRVNNAAQKGVYIVNGKKVIIK